MASNRKRNTTPANTRQAVAHEAPAPIAPVAPTPPTPVSSVTRCTATKRNGKACRQTELVPGHNTCVWHTKREARPADWRPTEGIAGAQARVRDDKRARRSAKLTATVASKQAPIASASDARVSKRLDRLEGMMLAMAALVTATSNADKQAAKQAMQAAVAA